jgi:hypothetical protein
MTSQRAQLLVSDSQQGRARAFLLFATASRPALGPTQPSVQWVPGVISPAAPGVKVTTRLRLMQKVRRHGVITPLHNTSSWRGNYLLPLTFSVKSFDVIYQFIWRLIHCNKDTEWSFCVVKGRGLILFRDLLISSLFRESECTDLYLQPHCKM